MTIQDTTQDTTRHLDHGSRLHLAILEEVARIEGLRRALYHKRLGAKGAMALRVLEDLAAQQDGTTAQALAQRLGLSGSTAARVLADLGERGWVRVGDHPRDRRFKALWLTEAGDAARGDLLAPLLGDAKRLTKLMRAEKVAGAHYEVQQYRRVVAGYVHSVQVPKRRTPRGRVM